MKLPLQVSFHGIDRSEALENLIAKESKDSTNLMLI